MPAMPPRPARLAIREAATDPRFLGAVWATYERKPDWQDYAACGGDDRDLYFPYLGDPPGLVAVAKRACNGTATRPPCPVAGHCLASALATGASEAGVWGGTTEGERTAMRPHWLK